MTVYSFQENPFLERYLYVADSDVEINTNYHQTRRIIPSYTSSSNHHLQNCIPDQQPTPQIPSIIYIIHPSPDPRTNISKNVYVYKHQEHYRRDTPPNLPTLTQQYTKPYSKPDTSSDLTRNQPSNWLTRISRSPLSQKTPHARPPTKTPAISSNKCARPSTKSLSKLEGQCRGARSDPLI